MMVAAWPPRWTTPFRTGDTWDSLPKRGEGILESITRREGDDTCLLLTMRFEARPHTGILRWEGPPPVAALEDLLNTHVGREIRWIGDQDC
jgi:hypothetical protein